MTASGEIQKDWQLP